MTTVEVGSADSVGPALREVRIAEGVTQSALADLAAVGRQWLNAFEMGDKPSAPLDMVMRVAAALGTRVTLAPTSGERTEPDEEPIDLDALLREFDR